MTAKTAAPGPGETMVGPETTAAPGPGETMVEPETTAAPGPGETMVEPETTAAERERVRAPAHRAVRLPPRDKVLPGRVRLTTSRRRPGLLLRPAGLPNRIRVHALGRTG